MPAYPGFVHASGPFELDRQSTAASAAIAVADSLEEDTGALSSAASGEKIAGVATESKASGDATTDARQFIQVYSGRTNFYGPRESGTLTIPDDRGLIVDLASADGLAFDVVTNGDFYIRNIIESGSTASSHARGSFASPAWHTV